MMRKTFAATTASLALLAMAAPAAAQSTSGGGNDFLSRILQVILGPTSEAQTETAETAETAPEASAATLQTRMERVLANPRRNADRDRDVWRHPAETLAFFKVRPGLAVVDYMPGSGYYTRILGPYLGQKGVYLGITPDPAAVDSPENRDGYARLPGEFRQSAINWSLRGAQVAIYNSKEAPAQLAGQVDRVLIFREMHNLLRSGAMYAELTRLRTMLKPDGLLGIVQHRARADAPADYTLGTNGYLREKDVIALVEAHGFQLVDKSEINANPRDPANHVGGVWKLPPTLSGNDPAMKAIGESDRMTLLFRKR